MTFIIGLIGLICLGKAVFMGWLHKSEWKLLRITDPGRWWKLQIKQAVWAVVGIVLIFIYGELSLDNGKESSGNTQSTPTEQTVVKGKAKRDNQKRVEQKESTSSSSPKEETEAEEAQTTIQQEAEEAQETYSENPYSQEEETSNESNTDSGQ